MKRSLSIIIVTFSFFKLEAQELSPTWTKFDTSRNFDSKKFSTLTEMETRLRSIIPAFVENRARLTLTDSANRVYPKELQQPNFPTPCQCRLQNDTIYVTAALGFMSGLGIKIAIHRNAFESVFFQESDNTPVFKKKENDTVYVDRIYVATESQKLTLSRPPSFNKGGTLFGRFEGQFQPFYEAEREKPLMRHYKARLTFRCVIEAL